MTPRPSRPIADYALISDCHSTALVASDGSIEWACLRRFDSGSVFSRMLDDRAGAFTIRPVGDIVERRRRYVPGTMVLETTLRTDSGTICVTDAFAMRIGGATDPRHQLIRQVEVESGEVDIEVTIEARFDYGRSHPWLRRHADATFSAVAGDDAIVVWSDIALDIDGESARIGGRANLSEGERARVSLVSQPAYRLDPSASVADVDQLMTETIDWWNEWSSKTVAHGRHAEAIERSALVLKSLCCAPTGAIVAAPTTSLPEIPGGSANWDYRYCWVRDTTLTLQALADVGHPEVAKGFRDFILRSAAGRGDELQIMYGAYGERRLPEFELDLTGWRNSSPVRIGNAAATQTQLDVFGHVLDAAHLWHDRTASIDDDEWAFLRSVVNQAALHRDTPDSGIWELRGEPQHYVHSKVMLWVALDRGIRLVEDFGLDCDHAAADSWRSARDGLRSDVERLGVDHRGGHFVQHYDSIAVDASLLKLPLVGFVDANDPRMVRTVEVIERDLGVGSAGFLRRFRSDRREQADEGPEGVFLLCTFWLVEVMALQGRIDEAEALFLRLVELGNDVGLFAEEYDVAAGEFLGNYPQAFTHLGLISAAHRLDVARSARD